MQNAILILIFAQTQITPIVNVHARIVHVGESIVQSVTKTPANANAKSAANIHAFAVGYATNTHASVAKNLDATESFAKNAASAVCAAYVNVAKCAINFHANANARKVFAIASA